MDRRKWAVKLDDDVIVNFTNTTFPMSTFTVIVFLTASSASLGLSRVRYSFIKKITYGKVSRKEVGLLLAATFCSLIFFIWTSCHLNFLASNWQDLKVI